MGRPKSQKIQNAKNSKFKEVIFKQVSGNTIKFKYLDNTELVTGKLLSKYQKATESNKNGWNVDINGDIKWIDFYKAVHHPEKVTYDEGSSGDTDASGETYFTETQKAKAKIKGKQKT